MRAREGRGEEEGAGVGGIVLGEEHPEEQLNGRISCGEEKGPSWAGEVGDWQGRERRSFWHGEVRFSGKRPEMESPPVEEEGR